MLLPSTHPMGPAEGGQRGPYGGRDRKGKGSPATPSAHPRLAASGGAAEGGPHQTHPWLRPSCRFKAPVTQAPPAGRISPSAGPGRALLVHQPTAWRGHWGRGHQGKPGLAVLMTPPETPDPKAPHKGYIPQSGPTGSRSLHQRPCDHLQEAALASHPTSCPALPACPALKPRTQVLW